MLLSRRRPKKSKARTYAMTMISLLILACEIWYVDALNAGEPKSSRMATSQEFVASNNLPLSNLLTENAEGEDEPRYSWQKGEMLNLAHILESVCIGSNPCVSINVSQLHTKEAK